MASVVDDRGYNQGFAPSRSTAIRMERRADLILSEMDIKPETKVLEIGCGTGEISHRIASRSFAEVLGTDLCEPFIRSAQEQFQLPNLTYEVLDFTRPDVLAGKRFDYIVGNGILHHLYSDLDGALSTMNELLKEGGKIVFMEPNIHNPYVFFIFSYPGLRRWARLEPDEMAFSRKEIISRLSRAGFNDIQVDYKDFLLPGIPDFLVGPSIFVGNILEMIPFVQKVTQSIFISARK